MSEKQGIDRRNSYLTKKDRECIEYFFQNFRLVQVCVEDPAENKDQRTPSLLPEKEKSIEDLAKLMSGSIKAEVTFVKKKSDEKLVEQDTGADWLKEYTMGKDVMAWKGIEKEWCVTIDTILEKGFFNVPGFKNFLEKKRMPPLMDDENILRALTVVAGIASQLNAVRMFIDKLIPPTDFDKMSQLSDELRNQLEHKRAMNTVEANA